MFILVNYTSKGLLYCEFKSICDGTHLLNFLPRQSNMTFNCHDSVHMQFIFSPAVLFMVYNNANMISYTTLQLKQFIKDTKTTLLFSFSHHLQANWGWVVHRSSINTAAFTMRGREIKQYPPFILQSDKSI